VFGSVLRDDFRPSSDVDFLVAFASDAHRTLLDLVEMEEGLGAMVGRKAELVERQTVEGSRNWIRRREILGSAARVFPVLDLTPTVGTFPSAHENGKSRISEQSDSAYAAGGTESRRTTRMRANLLDALTFSQELIQFTAKLEYDQFLADTKTQYAVLHLFTLLGEVVRRLPAKMLDAEPDIPWKKIVGMCNIIVHNYAEVNLHIVWESARDDLRAFLVTVQRLYSEYSSSADEEPDQSARVSTSSPPDRW
jgi:uncharacterized protein with HEPN domain/predicted nucleotidyltransferase